jgi:hypothetical protein
MENEEEKNNNPETLHPVGQDPRHRREHHHRHDGEGGAEHIHHHEGHFGGPGHRDFWREWREERHDHGHGPENGRDTSPAEIAALRNGPVPSPAEIAALREFFHKSFGTWPEEHWIFGGRRFSPWHQGMDSFNPFVASLLSKGGGLLPLYVLHLVAQQPRYGNEIMDLLAERTNGQWVSNPGAIYPLLALLEREGLNSRASKPSSPPKSRRP